MISEGIEFGFRDVLLFAWLDLIEVVWIDDQILSTELIVEYFGDGDSISSTT